MQSTHGFLQQIDRLKEALENAEAVLVGAGAGLSASAGLTYSGRRFHELFGDFEAKYGIRDMYSGGFFPFGTLEEYWAWWSRHIFYNRYVEPPKPVYQNLLKLVDGRDYFVITTNVDHCFQKAGFDKRRLFYTQGDYGLFQCSVPCHSQTYGNEETVRKMVAGQKGMKIPPELIPLCPKCGKPMTVNLRSDGTFVEDDGWNDACGRYSRFLESHKDCRMLYLELGVGSNTPGIIKYPFQQMTAENPRAVYACINRGEASCPGSIRSRSICIDADIGETVEIVIG